LVTGIGWLFFSLAKANLSLIGTVDPAAPASDRPAHACCSSDLAIVVILAIFHSHRFEFRLLIFDSIVPALNIAP